MRLSNLIARAENATVAAYRTTKPVVRSASDNARCATSQAMRKVASWIEPSTKRVAR